MVDLSSRVRVSGPLEPFAAGFGSELLRQGYTAQPAAQQLRLMAHVSRWLSAQGGQVGALDAVAAEAFAVSRRAAGYSTLLTVDALVPLLAYLRGLGIVAQPDVLLSDMLGGDGGGC
jgi:hypothetical protein